MNEDFKSTFGNPLHACHCEESGQNWTKKQSHEIALLSLAEGLERLANPSIRNSSIP